MSFRGIKGQDRVIAFLKEAIKNSRIAHAYLFLGPEGVGKKTTALNFAKAINCSSLTEDGPCDACDSCRKIDSRNHPDIFTVEPEKKGGSIKIDRIRELIRKTGFKSYEGRKKVSIIDSADSMTEEAANAILKTLEEPPPESVFILIAENLSYIFPTIRSRSEIIKFYPLGIDEIKRVLLSEYKIDEVKAHILSHLSSGSLGRALRLKETDIFERREMLLESLEKEAFLDLDFDNLSREELILDLDIILTWYRDIMTAKIGNEDGAFFINIDRADALRKKAGESEEAKIEGVINQIISTGYFLEQNANQKLAMSVLGLKLQEAKA